MSENESKTLWVAIIGSGPAGYYTAEGLVKNAENVRVDIIDRLPTPYGLIRGGVAPDHQSIKGVMRRYEKTSGNENVRFLGNVEIGRDVSLAELREMYDAVVIAAGAPNDRRLGIPGDDRTGVIGSAAFVGWYNGHPDFAGLSPDLAVKSVAVIGNGNVAVDVVRILAKTTGEMAASDLTSYAGEAIQASAIEDLWMLGRRGPVEAKFTHKELGELGELENCVALVDGGQIPDELGDIPEKAIPVKTKNLNHLRAFAENKPGDKPLRLHIAFCARPVEVLGDERVTGLRLEKTRAEDGKYLGTGETFDIECGLIIPCIGYLSDPMEGATFDEARGRFPNEDGKIEDRLYVVGWARRGPTGTIGTNRPDGMGVAERILAEVSPRGKPCCGGLDRIASERGFRITSFDDWKKIEAAEIKAAQGVAPRAKISHIEEMLTLLDKC